MVIVSGHMHSSLVVLSRFVQWEQPHNSSQKLSSKMPPLYHSDQEEAIQPSVSNTTSASSQLSFQMNHSNDSQTSGHGIMLLSLSLEPHQPTASCTPSPPLNKRS